MPGRPPELWLPGSVFRAQEEPLCAPTPTHESTWEGAFLGCVCFLNLCNQRTRCGHVIREPCPKNPSVRFQPWRLTFQAFTHAQDRREEPKNKRCSWETPNTQSKPSTSGGGWEPAQQFWGAGPDTGVELGRNVGRKEGTTQPLCTVSSLGEGARRQELDIGRPRTSLPTWGRRGGLRQPHPSSGGTGWSCLPSSRPGKNKTQQDEGGRSPWIPG